MPGRNRETQPFTQTPRVENKGQTDMERLTQAMNGARTYLKYNHRSTPHKHKAYTQVVADTESTLTAAIQQGTVATLDYEFPGDESYTAITHVIGEELTQNRSARVTLPREALSPGELHSHYDAAVVNGLYVHTYATRAPDSSMQQWHRELLGVDVIPESAKPHVIKPK